ncbi:ABC transporter permease [Vineibacter terrae]|uniref:ABC transporter permease n=1 Tax=Vineibacter terrae TaxID=2586908 RepID=UPI002E37C31C|nr:ABC transporter permease [Vineibacter terrae]HEX2892300.1 ABC transporter permease [Vineibacter terrae]
MRGVHALPPRRPLRRLFAAVGDTTLGGLRGAATFAALAATVVLAGLRRSTWRPLVRLELRRVLHGVTVRALGTTIVASVLLGFALVTQAAYWLAATGQTGLIGTIIVLVLVREIAPILVGLIVLGRSGTATLIELGEARPKGWLRLMEMQGLDPVACLIMPRALGFAIGAFCLATILITSTLLAGYLVAHAIGLVAYSLWDFAGVVLQAMGPRDFVLPPLKCLAIGFFVGLVCCAIGLARREEGDDLQRVVPRGFVRSAIAILLVNGLFDLAL